MREQGRRVGAASHFRDQYWNDQDVRIVERQQKIGRDRFLSYDASIDCGQDRLGELYVRRNKLYSEVRNGLTLACLNSKSKSTVNNSRDEQTIWAACSHPCPLQLNLHYLQNRPLLPKQEYLLSRLTFEKVVQGFRQGARVELVAASRHDGYEARISYCYDLDVWVICCRNVSLFALTAEDLQKCAAEWRDEPVGGVARLWLGRAAGMSREELIEAKRTLDGFTAMAWYCTGASLVKNKHNQLIFFAMVQNDNREEFCLDPFEARTKLEKLGVEFTSLRTIVKIENDQDLRENLEELYREVGEAALEDPKHGREGCTVYLVEHRDRKRSSDVQVVGAGLLLTMEYRIFRQIRQFLLDFNDSDYSRERTLLNFQRKCAELYTDCQCYPPYPIEYYQLLFSKGLDFIATVKTTNQQLLNEMPTLLDCLHYTAFKNIPLTKELREDRAFLEKVRGIKWSQYDGIGCRGFTIYVPIALESISRSRLYQRMESEFTRLGYRSTKITSIGREGEQREQDNSSNGELIKCLKEGFAANYELKQYFIYLDCLNSPSEITELLKTLAKEVDRKFCYKVIYVIPKTVKPLMINRSCYWFDLESIAACLAASVLSSKDKAARITELGRQLRLFSISLDNSENFSFRDFERQCTREYEFPFSTVAQIPDRPLLEDLLEALLKACKGKNHPEESLLEQLLSLASRLEVEWTSQQVLENQVQELISSAFPKIPSLHLS